MNGKGSFVLCAAEHGDLNGIIHALENGDDIETRDANGQTPLLLAAEKGHFGIVRELIHRNANVNARDQDGWTALIAACKGGYPDVVATLLHNGARHNIADMGGWTPLVWASYKGHNSVVRELLRYGADPNERGQHNMTALIWAAGRGHTNVVRELLESGARAEIADKYGTTALIWACRKGHFEVADLLISKGANVNSVGTHGWTPLIMSGKGGFVDVVNLLLESRANVNLVDQDGRSALTWASKCGHEATVRALLNHGVYLNMPDKHGDTPLIIAAREGHPDVIKALLSKYADLELTDSEGKTALYKAVEKGHVDCVRELLVAGANTETTNKDGETPLIRGAKKKHTLCVKLLLENGANPAAVDKKGDTALHISVRLKYAGLCEVLLRDQKNSRLLYKPNKAGDTPYSIDRANKQSVLSPIFGNRDLSADISRMELPSGQDKFVMALADFISDPSLSTPLTVGLFSRWGTGKSVILQRIYEQLKAYAFQEAIVLFRITSGVLLTTVCITITIGLITWAVSTWVEGLLSALATFVVLMALIILGRSSHRSHAGNSNRCGLKLLQLFERAVLFFRLVFCVPPSIESVRPMLPIHFIFVDLTKSTIFGDNPLTALVNLARELNDAVEKDYGVFVTRLYRVFRSGPYRARQISHLNLKSRWKTSCCCLPSVFFTILVLFALWVGLFCLAIFKKSSDRTILGIEIGSACVIGLAFIYSIPRLCVIIYCLVLSMKKRIMIVASQPGIRDETFLHVLKQEIDLQADMLECLDGFTRRQTRVVLFIDLLESLEQQKVLHFVNSINALLSETGHPFLSLISVDPRLLLKAIDQNLQLLQDSHISPYDYFKNTVDLPCYFSDQSKTPTTGFLPKDAIAAVSGLSDNAEQFEANQDLEWGAGMIEDDEDEDDDSLRAGCNGKVPLIENRPSTARRLSNVSSNYSDDHRDRDIEHNGNIHYEEKDNVSTDLSKFLQDNESGSLADVKRIMNIVSLTGRLLHARNIPFRWRTLASWVSLADAWPYKISWLILLAEDNSLNLKPELSLRKLYSVAGAFMPVLGEPDMSLDADIVYFETYLSNRHPLLTLGDMCMFLPCTFHIDPAIRKSMAEYLQTVKTGSVTKAQIAGSVAESVTQHVTSPSSSRFMWRSVGEDAILSQMSSDDVIKQIAEIDGINCESIALYQMQLKDHNINGKVLAACDLNELRDAMQMAFGDWQLFKAWILQARTREQSVSPRVTMPPLSFQSHSRADSTVEESRTDSTSEIPNSPGTSRGCRGVSSGSEHAAGMPPDYDETNIDAKRPSKGPYGSHTVRQVLSRNQNTPSRQIKQDSIDSEKSGKFVKGTIGLDDLMDGRKPENFNSHIRYLNHLQRSADSGFASTEVEAQQQARLKPLMRQTSVQENKEYEIEMAELCSSKTAAKVN
ncbi:kinase D-interacting substrate of 220 kDa B-like isoform X2 [Rhopilema esculentum]